MKEFLTIQGEFGSIIGVLRRKMSFFAVLTAVTVRNSFFRWILSEKSSVQDFAV
jgi:hypothetical protein